MAAIEPGVAPATPPSTEPSFPPKRWRLRLSLILYLLFDVICGWFLAQFMIELVEDGFAVVPFLGAVIAAVCALVGIGLTDMVSFVLHVPGPILVLSAEGLRWRAVSDTLIPWAQVRRPRVTHGDAGDPIAVVFRLDDEFSVTLPRRGAVANSYKANRVTIRLAWIAAPPETVLQAFSPYITLHGLWSRPGEAPSGSTRP